MLPFHSLTPLPRCLTDADGVPKLEPRDDGGMVDWPGKGVPVALWWVLVEPGRGSSEPFGMG